MISDLVSALTRAILVALLIATPALMLPDTSANTAQFTTVLAILGGLFILIEYQSRFPSLTEFRFAPPYNRLRFGALSICVVMITLAVANAAENAPKDQLLFVLGHKIAHAFDFPYSPVQLFLTTLPENASQILVDITRFSTGVAYFISLMTVMVFYIVIRYLDWPFRDGSFNIFTNLPRFDPTGGGDVLYKLKRNSNINIILGICLPFILPIAINIGCQVYGPLNLAAPQTIIWIVNLWAMMPATMIMRGLAMGRIAQLIEDKRRRAYARAQEARLQTS